MLIPLSPSPALLLHSSAPLLAQCNQMLTHRVNTPEPPSYMAASHASFLESLSVADLHFCETRGLSAFLHHTTKSPPSSLLHFVHHATHFLHQIPPFTPTNPSIPAGRSARRSKKRPRATKRAQMQHLLPLIQSITSNNSSPVLRVVDIGAGHAHLAGLLASHLDIPVVAVDRDGALLDTAASIHAELLARNAGQLVLSRVHVGNAQLQIGGGDLVVGLHPCGTLGDTIVETVVNEGCAAVLFVSCCLQKLRPGVERREALSNVVKNDETLREALVLPRDQLGATNRTRGFQHEKDVIARETRYALRGLLADHGVHVEKVGDEVCGISRHRLRKGLESVAEDALKLRGIETDLHHVELKQRATRAKHEYTVMRKLSLLRALAGQVMEAAVVLDRAAALEESSHFNHVSVFRAWTDEISVRNLCCAAYK